MGHHAAESVVIKNIFYMMAYATGTSGKDAKSTVTYSLRNIETEDFDSFLDILAEILVNAIYLQQVRGFDKEYKSVNEELGVIRGKLLLRDTMILRSKGSLNTICEYDVLVSDTYMNRILRTTVEHLLRHKELNNDVRKRLRYSLLLLDGVKSLSISEIDWRVIRYNHLNQSYRFLMSVCRMILEGSLPTESEGVDARFPNFLSKQSLYSLYQNFLLQYFKVNHPELDPKAQIINGDIKVDKSVPLPTLRSDVILHGKKSDLIIEAKCYGKILDVNYGKRILRPKHRNQVFSYVLHYSSEPEIEMASKRVSGMLLYAQTKYEDPIDYSWEELGHHFSAQTLDLGGDFCMIERQLERIALSVK